MAVALGVALLVTSTAPAGAVTVNDEATFRAAWSNGAETQIDLTADITLTCGSGAAQRNSATPLILDGHGHSITPGCADRPALVILNATSVANSSPVTFRNVTINRGNATGPVAASNSVVVGVNASPAAVGGMTQVITVEVRRLHHQRHHHVPRRHEPRTAPAAPVPAAPVPAVVTFTG